MLASLEEWQQVYLMAILDNKSLSWQNKKKLQNFNACLKLMHKFKMFQAVSAKVFIKAVVLIHLLEVG
jgi:hypothetical protein